MGNCSSCPSKGSCSSAAENGEGKCPSDVFTKLQPKYGNIKNIIGVISGKGGVGKSTITGVLATQLAEQGYKVGVLDADITGPSIPRLLGISNQRARGTQEFIYPVINKDGIKVMSLNLLIENEDEPVIWRGAMVSSTVKQFYTDVLWEDLDYLIIDMPPGTGDVALTVMQSIPIDGIVMVTIPQDMVSMIVSKAIHMVNKLNIDVIGVVENMSYVKCPDCGTKIQIFSGDNSRKFLDDMNLNLLGQLPMNSGIGNVSVGIYNEDDEEVEQLFNPIVTNMINSLNDIEQSKVLQR